MIWQLAQTDENNKSAGEAAGETARQAGQILSQITTWKIAQALIIVAVAFVVIKSLDWIVIRTSERVAKEWRLRIKQFLPFIRTLVMTTAVVTLMNLFLNLSRDNVLAVTGTIAVALGFAFKDYASSIIAGLIGLFEAPYRVGDRIRIADHYGEVVSYGLRAIRLKTPTDNVVTVPHNHIWTSTVSNANMGALEAQVVTEFYLAHDVDAQRVKQILLRVAYTSKYTHLTLPVVVIMQEKSWGSLFKLKSYPLDARDEFLYMTDLTTRAKRMFAKHQFAYPRWFDANSNTSIDE
nr:mechanosensitive ion channel family protein [Romeria gracilis]